MFRFNAAALSTEPLAIHYLLHPETRCGTVEYAEEDKGICVVLELNYWCMAISDNRLLKDGKMIVRSNACKREAHIGCYSAAYKLHIPKPLQSVFDWSFSEHGAGL